MNDDHPLGESAELAALYVSGAMSVAERAAFETHLDERCADCEAELQLLNAAASGLAEFAESQTPDQDVMAKLLQRIASGPTVGDASNGGAVSHPGGEQVWRQWRGDPPQRLCTVRAGEGDWETTGVEGVSIRRLFVDSAQNQFTGMVRMAAGASYPRHVHHGAEECLVLEGDLHVGDLVLHAGDYQRAPAGSQHGIQSTDGGCLLLITSSLSDDFV